MSSKIDWEDRVLAELVRLSWPITVSVLSYAVMTLVDTLFVGRLGPSALAGVGLAGTACFATLGFGLGMLRATKVVVSQEFGARRDHTLGSHINSSLVLSMVLALGIVLIAWLVSPWLARLNESAQAAEYARQYFLTRMLSAPALLAYGTLREARFGVGDSRTPMIATVSGNAVNTVLDYLFIIELGWGVPGAAYATNAGHVVEAVVLLWVHFRGSFRHGAVRLRLMIPLLRLGFPLGTQFVLEIGAFTLLAAMISRISDLQMAAHQIAVQVLHLGFLPAYAVGESASVLTGQAVGAHRDALIKPIAHLALKVIVAYTALAGVTMGLFGVPIASAFTRDASVVAATAGLLVVGGLFQVGDGANILARAVLRGTGDVRWSAVVSVGIAWGFTPPLMWLFGYRMGLGALGGWIGLLAEIFAGAAVLWWRLEGGGWHPSAEQSRARQRELEATERPELAEQPA